MPVCSGNMNIDNSMLSKEETIWSDVLRELLMNQNMLNKYIRSGKERIKDFNTDTIHKSWQQIINEFKY